MMGNSLDIRDETNSQGPYQEARAEYARSIKRKKTVWAHSDELWLRIKGRGSLPEGKKVKEESGKERPHWTLCESKEWASTSCIYAFIAGALV